MLHVPATAFFTSASSSPLPNPLTLAIFSTSSFSLIYRTCTQNALLALQSLGTWSCSLNCMFILLCICCRFVVTSFSKLYSRYIRGRQVHIASFLTHFQFIFMSNVLHQLNENLNSKPMKIFFNASCYQKSIYSLFTVSWCPGTKFMVCLLWAWGVWTTTNYLAYFSSL